MESLRHHWGFLDSSMDPRLALAGTYDPVLVMLSVVIASLAAYAVLGLAERINAADKPLAKRAWLAAGAVTMGIGVWAMHFIGMLAFRLPVRVNYDVWVTLLSVAPAVLASGIMLYVISQARISPGKLILGGALMGAGIGVMRVDAEDDHAGRTLRPARARGRRSPSGGAGSRGAPYDPCARPPPAPVGAGPGVPGRPQGRAACGVPPHRRAAVGCRG